MTLSQEQLQDLAGAGGQRGAVARRALRVQGLPQGRRPVRSHRVPVHVRARGVNHYVTFFRKVRSACRRGHGCHPYHRSLRAADGDQSVHRQVHLPRRLYPGAVGDGGGHRALRADDQRLGGLAAALRRYAAGLARALANWDKAAGILDEKFCRMWEFYLAGSETAFRYQNLVVFQVQLVKRIGALPTTRDYMLTDERRLFEQEQIGPPRMAGE